MGALEMAFNIIARDGASQAFLKVSESAKALQRTVQEADAKMGASTKAATAEMSAALAGLDRAHQSYAVQYDRANATIIASDDSVLVMQRKMAASTGALLAEQKKAAAANVQMDGAMAKAQTDLAAKQVASSAARGKAFKDLGKVSALILVGIAAESIKMAGDFQQQTNILVTSAGESTKSLKMVRAGILSIASETGTKWQDLTDGMYRIEKAGFRGADGLNILHAAAQGAREEGTSLEVVTGSLTSALLDYHLPASAAVMVTNEMKTAAGEAKATFGEFDKGLGTILYQASRLHISFADISGTLAEMTQHGLSAERSSDQLSNAMRNLAKSNGPAQKMMAQLGIDSMDVAAKLGDGPGGRGLAGTMQYLSDVVLKHMGPAGMILLTTMNSSKIAAHDADVMFNALPDAAKKVAQAYKDGHLSSKEWILSTGHLDAAQASLARQWAIGENRAKGFQQTLRSGLSQSQTYNAAMQTMTGGANGLSVALNTTGQNAADTNDRIKRVGDSAVGAGKDVSGWASTLGLSNVQSDRLKQALHGLMIGLGTTLLPVATKVFSVLADHPGVLKALIYSIGTLLVAATVAWTAALVANPVGLFVIALGALVGAVIYSWTHFQTFRDIVTTVFTVLTNVISGAIIGYLRYFKWFGDTVFSVGEGIGHVLLTMAQVSDRVLGTNLAGSVRAGLGHMQDFRAGFDGAMNSAIGGVQDMRDKVNETLRSLDGKAIKFSVTAEGVVTAAAFAAGGGVAKLGAAARFGFADGGVLPSSAMIQPATAGRGLVQWAEPSTHGEAFIPLSPSKRGRSVDIWQQTGKMLGQFADGGFTDSASGPIRTGLQDFAREVEATVAQAAQAAAKSAAMAAAAAASSAPGGKYTGAVPTGSSITRWAPLVLAVLGELGLSGGLVGKVLTQIGTESGGDPNATQGNIGDVNNASGDLARGLLQVIGGTFRANAGPYLSLGQYNPHASIYAGLHYAEGRYGPDLSFLGQGHGYALGGMPPVGVPYWTGEKGPELRVDSVPGRILSHADSMKALGGRNAPLVGTVHIHDNVGLELLLQQAQFRESAGHFG